MSLSTYLLGIAVSTILCWLSWILTVININPETAGALGFASFFASLFFAIVGTLTLLGFYARLWFTHNQMYYQNIGTSFRQGLFFGSAVISLLVMQAIRLFNWWNGILIIMIFVLLELYFLARKK